MNMRLVARSALVVFATLVLVYLLWVFRQALVLFIFSLAVAAAARTYVDALAGRGVARSLAIILVYLVFLGLIIGTFIFAGSELLRELQVLADNLAGTYDQIVRTWPDGTEFQQTIARQLPAPEDLYASFSVDQQGGGSALSGLLGFTVSTLSFFGQIASVLILSIYWSFDRVHFERLWLSLLPVAIRSRARDIWRSVEQDFGAYVHSEVLQSILATILLGLGFWFSGMPYPLLLAVFGGVIWLIPWLGGVLAVLPAVVSGMTVSTGLAVFGAAYVIGVLFFLEFFVEPRFIRRGQFSSLLSILLIIAFVEPLGLLGLIVAPPLAAAVELLVRYNIETRSMPAGTEVRDRLSEVRGRLLLLQEAVGSSEEPAQPRLLNMLGRLEALVERTDETLEGRFGAAPQTDRRG